MIGIRSESGATPSQLVQLTGLPPGTVRPKLSELVKLRLVAKRGDAYEVPIHSISRALKALSAPEGR
jgi:DNA-binding IclR family transcriptional regulator